jgi:ADP-ribosylglycohydrolase
MKDILIGMAVGDALGVPYEFLSRAAMQKSPATEMVGYGTHNQPKGTWSDDTSMALCLTESLCDGLNYDDIAKKFAAWFYDAWWTPHGDVFDHGFATADSQIP